MDLNKHINSFRSENHKKLDYQVSFFKDQTQINLWEEKGHNLDNTVIGVFQITDPENYTEFLMHFNELDHIGLCFHKLEPGKYLPEHVDRYGLYKEKYSVTDINKIVRYVVFLEDWANGHFLTVNDKTYTNWKAGDCVGWAGETPHSALT